MSPVFRMTTFGPDGALAKEIVGAAAYLLRFAKDFVDGFDDSVQVFPIVHTDSTSKRWALGFREEAVSSPPLIKPSKT